ncbi:MAG: RNA 2',3'-cyclic phosphodiesterase [Chloroherpetonaceae bacterium]|nr:RNA 2',3'-cyclic phosphodiesterase [Chthonomonadaceae bacterium]MDW8206852.1 RNA 2',3'-cyclic phosphodiesterase [Chloroherpetonaceae bacterium]
MLRLFFAVEIPPAIRADLARVQARLRAAAGEHGIRWEAADKFHITLKFLGETPETQVHALHEAATQAASRIAPFSLSLAGIGAFPGLHRPHVLWAGTGEGFPVLQGLAEYLDQLLTAHGFSPERRRFHAHITLARARCPSGQAALARVLKQHTETVDKIGTFQVSCFVLMRSELRPSGSVYTVQEHFTLSPRATGYL